MEAEVNDKLRNRGGDTLMGLAQWLGRKVRNHDPMMTLDKGVAGPPGSQAIARRISDKPQPGKASVTLVTAISSAPIVLYELADGRLFELMVREAAPRKYQGYKRIAVGS